MANVWVNSLGFNIYVINGQEELHIDTGMESIGIFRLCVFAIRFQYW